ncbi:MAG TPA: alpha/beta hydrolase [Chitinophagaceae bacterium]|nr:alpha/beta hydrolase [Chitinophagaceae bacterium]
MNKEIEIGGKKIFYDVYGNGKPVMLVHGFGETGNVWEKQVAFLKDSFFLIVPDLPGSGKSEMIDNMSIEGMAEVLKEILDKETIEQVAMIGHSMGGYITLAFTKKYSRNLNAFGLFHSTAYADSEEKKTVRKKGIEFIRKNGTLEFIKTTTPNLFSPFSQEQKPRLIDEFIRGLDNFSIPAFVSYYEAMMQRPDSTELLKTTTLPVLFVLGEFDNAVPLQDGLKLAHLPEKSYIHILHQSGHMGMLEEEDKSNDLLKKFLSET